MGVGQTRARRRAVAPTPPPSPTTRAPGRHRPAPGADRGQRRLGGRCAPDLHPGGRARRRCTTRSALWRWRSPRRSPRATASTAARTLAADAIDVDVSPQDPRPHPLPQTAPGQHPARHRRRPRRGHWTALHDAFDDRARARLTRAATSTCWGTSATPPSTWATTTAHRRFYALMLSTARENGRRHVRAVRPATPVRSASTSPVSGRRCGTPREEAVALGRSVGQPAADRRPAGVADTARRTKGRPDYDARLAELDEQVARTPAGGHPGPARCTT